MLKTPLLISLGLALGLMASKTFAQTPKLASILRPQTLGTQIAWLERQIGPAKTIYGKDREYIIDKCTLHVHLDTDNSIANLGLSNLSPACTFNTDAIGFKGPAHLLRFKDLIEHMDWTADAICLFNCGNSTDPVYTLQGEGPRVVQFLEYRTELSSAAAGKSGEAFSNEILAKVPLRQRDALTENPVKSVVSEPIFSAIWFKHFGPKRLESLYFGYRLKNP